MAVYFFAGRNVPLRRQCRNARANTGISGFIDPFGRIVEATSIFTEQAVQSTMQVWRPHTFYSQHGDVFAYGCVIICALLCLFGYFRTKGPEPDPVAATPI